MIFWVPLDRVSEALQALGDAKQRCGVAWTQGETHRPATGAQMLALREAADGGEKTRELIHMRIIFTSKPDAMLFKLRWI